MRLGLILVGHGNISAGTLAALSIYIDCPSFAISKMMEPEPFVFHAPDPIDFQLAEKIETPKTWEKSEQKKVRNGGNNRKRTRYRNSK